MLNLELAELQTGQIFDIFFGETAYLVNISRANFNYVLLPYPILKFLFLKNEVIFSKRLLFELRQKG